MAKKKKPIFTPEWAKRPCNHPQMDIVGGDNWDCNFCHSSRQYCPDCGHEEDLHDQRCPNDVDFPKDYLAIVLYKDMPYRTQHNRVFEEKLGLTKEATPNGRWYIIREAAGGITDQGREWLECDVFDNIINALSKMEAQG